MGYVTATLTSDFGFGLLFGASLLILGISLGAWFTRQRNTRSDAPTLEAYHLAAVAKGLSRLTDGFASDVSEYRDEVDQFGASFEAASQEGLERELAPILPLLSRVMNANESIADRVAKAEDALQKQKQEIAGFMSEARTDALTGLPNRRAFDDKLSRQFTEWRKKKRPVSVLLFDIDLFKRFNDAHGHLAGDAVLAHVARVMRDSLYESDLVARLGGEEFAAILPNCYGADAARVAERVRSVISESSLEYETKKLSVTVSVGAAQATQGESASSLIKRSDESMYASKNAGRNCAHLHTGRAIVPITRGLRSGTVSNRVSNPTLSHPEPPKLKDKAEFRQVCKDLRQRLLNVVESD